MENQPEEQPTEPVKIIKYCEYINKKVCLVQENVQEVKYYLVINIVVFTQIC